MSSAVNLIADALVASLNAGSFSQDFTASRSYEAEVELDAVSTLEVLVVPDSEAVELESRDTVRGNWVVDVVVAQRLTPATGTGRIANADLDALMDFVQEIKDHFLGETLTSSDLDISCDDYENTPVYHPAALKDKNVFASVVRFSWLGWRAA